MPLNNEQFEYVRELVRKRSSISFDQDKVKLVEMRLGFLIQKEGLASLEALFTMLRGKEFSDLHRKVIDALLINETSFFRDVHPFETLTKMVLPKLITAREAEKKIRIWCAACSSGQEPYSIAMLFKESFPAVARHWEFKILSTDLSREIITKAKEGVFNHSEVSRGLPETFLAKYFEKHGSNWQIKDEIKQMVEFRELNLTGPWPILPMMDVIFLRNVLIYFDFETKKRVVGKIRRSLNPDGFLFLGSVETVNNLDESFESIWCNKSVCYRPK